MASGVLALGSWVCSWMRGVLVFIIAIGIGLAIEHHINWHCVARYRPHHHRIVLGYEISGQWALDWNDDTATMISLCCAWCLPRKENLTDEEGA